jgi:hypothetical protein
MQEEIKKIVLSQTTEQKIELLEDSFDQGFNVFWSIANIFLEAPISQGGLPTELIDKIFKRKNNENS